MYYAWALLLLCSCRKVDDFANTIKPNTSQQVAGSGKIENLGHVFTGSNITWKIHPQDPNNSPLITYSQNQNSGYNMIMIDNGESEGRTPTDAMRFIVVDLQNFTSKIVDVKSTDGTTVTTSLGRVVRYIFGMDKNYYVVTEASAGGGGHLIKYNPNTQAATDLGKPFNTSSGYLDIYSLNTGTDGALYGGSFGGDGQVYTFRYDYSQLKADAAPLDNTSRYVTAVSGDSRYTYAVCGKNNWYLYAIDRQTGEKRTLKCNYGPAISLSMSSHTDAPYAQSQATHIKLDGFDCFPLPVNERPSTARVEYIPYDVYDVNVPKVAWMQGDSRVAFKLKSGQTGYVNVTGLTGDVYPTSGPAAICDNKVFISNDKLGILGAYTPGSGFNKIGSTNMVINAITAPPTSSADAGKVFMGGYPKGLFLEYAPSINWSLNLPDLSSVVTSGFGTSTSNPGQRAMFQDADASGVYGSMSLLSIAYSKNGYIAGAGNNDRITASGSRELSIGTYKNGTVRNFYIPEFSNYDFMSMCLSKDSNYAYVCGYPHAGNVAKIYKYNPVTNELAGAWDLTLWGDNVTAIYPFTNDLLVGFCGDAIYLFDTNTGQITWKQSLGGGQKIYSMALGPDNSVYANHLYRSIFNFKIERFTIDVSDKANIKSTASNVVEFEDADHDERYKPGGMLVGPGLVPGKSELYITGLPSFYKVAL